MEFFQPVWSMLVGIWNVVVGIWYYLFSATVGVLLISTILLWWCLRRPKERGASHGPSGEEHVTTPSGRMRKRDIVRYYGRRMIRKAHAELGRRPRERVADIARKFLQGPEIPERQLYQEPPPAFLEADYLEGDTNVPSEVLYLLKSVRAFGHFEKPLFMELCKHVETKFVPAGAILFRPGQTDDSIYVVRNGRLKVFVMEQDGSELPLKEAGTGDSVHSMLSILDAVTGHPKHFKSVAARAIRDSYVLQMRAIAFQKFFEDNPDSLLRMVQIVMLRLQRVTFLALNQFLGLGRELLNQKPHLSFEYKVTKLKQRPPMFSQSSVPAESPAYTAQAYAREMHTPADSDSDTPMGLMRTWEPGPSKKLHSVPTEGRGLPVQSEGSDSSQNPLGAVPGPTRSRRTQRPESLSDDSSGHAVFPDSPSLPAKRTVAIDVSLNESFTHRPLPLQSLEFDQVINQARVDRQEFSTEGFSDGGGGGRTATGRRSIPLSFSHFASLESEEVLKAATEDLVKILQLKDDSLLKGRIQLIEVAADSLLGLEGDLESCVYFIASGRLKVFKHVDNKVSTAAQDLLYVAFPGEFCGVLSALTGEPAFISIMAAVDAHLIAITKTNLYHIMSEHPQAVCGLAFDLVQRLSPIVRQIDFALDWMELEAGRALYKQGDDANAAYIILNGRVRSVVKRADGKKELVDEFGRGETIGVVEVMTDSECATTVHAIRDTELACLPAGLLNTIKLKQPQVVSRLIQLLGEKILGSYNRVSGISTGNSHSVSSTDTRKHMASNLATVAVVAMTSDIPLSHFTNELCSAINTIAPAMRLTSGLIQKELGSTALESMHEYRLRTWLGHQEDNHRIVVYQADAELSPWTARCIRQADCILLVGLAEKGPSHSMGQIVKQVESISIRVQKELVLLHRENIPHPTGTVKWLNALGWLSSYFHVRCPDYFFTWHLGTDEESNLPPPSRHSDFARLARRLTGTSVGLVLGGGGARGIAHVGALKAFAEAGVPIDMIGGTSIGSFVGALYCEERNAERVEKRAREWAVAMARYPDKIFDLTYPTTSMFTGRAFNNLIHNVFGEKQIEDMWIPYFCVTTDITESKMRVHSSGCLWRYVRSSMSLSGYMPPLCDPVDGHLLLDGGYVNNLPADVIAAQGAETIIAIDVGAEDNNDLTNYGDHISGWYLVWNKLNPFTKTIRVPNLTEIQSRLAYVSCIRQLEAVKSDGMCEYIRPPIDNIKTLQFGSFDDIMPLGYRHCKTVISGWQKNKEMKHLLTSSRKEEGDKKHRQLLIENFKGLTKHSSVRDLAALAAQIPRYRLHPQLSDEGEEPDGGPTGYWSNPEDPVFGEDGQLSDSHSADSPVNQPGRKIKFITCSDSELP